jgi:hypothetical protein
VVTDISEVLWMIEERFVIRLLEALEESLRVLPATGCGHIL